VKLLEIFCRIDACLVLWVSDFSRLPPQRVEGTREGTVEGTVEVTREGTREGTVEGTVEGTMEGTVEGTMVKRIYGSDIEQQAAASNCYMLCQFETMKASKNMASNFSFHSFALGLMFFYL
jgi:hypothetical protein